MSHIYLVMALCIAFFASSAFSAAADSNPPYTCGDYMLGVQKEGEEHADETVLSAIREALDAFPKLVARGVYDQRIAAGDEDAFDKALAAYTDNKAASDLAKLSILESIKKSGVRSFMAQVCPSGAKPVRDIVAAFIVASKEFIRADPPESALP